MSSPVVGPADIIEAVEGAIEGWFPGHPLLGSSVGYRQFKVVYIGKGVYEVRDHLNGQDIVGRFRVTANVEKIGA